MSIGAQQQVFLLGAGFNVDAAAEAGPIYGDSIYIGRHEIDCAYPLALDLAHLCFGIDSLPDNKTIEDLFHEAELKQDRTPRKRLGDRLFKADFWRAATLARPPSDRPNCYLEFFRHFKSATFLTFNCDSLPEIILSELKAWSPHDGYGIPVRAISYSPEDQPHKQNSSARVLHLHGSLCVRTSTTEFRRESGSRIDWLIQRTEPLYLFDPDSSVAAFPGYRNALPQLGFERPEERVIAPIPDKAKGLRRVFVREMYRLSTATLEGCPRQLVVVGYSFNPYDRSSYDPILAAALRAGSQILLVSPDACEVRQRLVKERGSIPIISVPLGFAAWAKRGYPGLLE